MTRQKSGRGFWFGLTFGVALGVALAILFLPRPSGTAAGDQSETDGFDLRQRIQERFGPLIERLRARFSEAFALGQDFYQQAKDDVMTQYNTAKNSDFSSTPDTPETCLTYLTRRRRWSHRRVPQRSLLGSNSDARVKMIGQGRWSGPSSGSESAVAPCE